MLTSDVLVIIATLLCGWLLWLFMGPSMDVPAKEGAAAVDVPGPIDTPGAPPVPCGPTADINMEQMVRDNAAAEAMMAKLVASDVHAVLSTGGNRGTCSECGGLPKQGPPPKFAVGKLLACAGCQAAWYCDKTCQGANWKKHKKVCKLLLKPPKNATDVNFPAVFTDPALDSWHGLREFPGLSRAATRVLCCAPDLRGPNSHRTHMVFSLSVPTEVHLEVGPQIRAELQCNSAEMLAERRASPRAELARYLVTPILRTLAGNLHAFQSKDMRARLRSKKALRSHYPPVTGGCTGAVVLECVGATLDDVVLADPGTLPQCSIGLTWLPRPLIEHFVAAWFHEHAAGDPDTAARMAAQSPDMVVQADTIAAQGLVPLFVCFLRNGDNIGINAMGVPHDGDVREADTVLGQLLSATVMECAQAVSLTLPECRVMLHDADQAHFKTAVTNLGPA